MNKELIDKFFSGKCTSEEAATFLKWLQSKKSDAELEAYLQKHWQEMDDESDIQPQVLQKLNNIIDASQDKKLRKRRYLSKVVSLAASITLFGLLTFGLYQYLQQEDDSIKIASRIIKEVTKSTAKGQKLTINLPDGSIVMLNSASDITYPEVFTDSIRKVKLRGEAFFQVKESEIPFIVSTGEVQTRVLGTSFNIRYRTDEKSTEIALLTGRVKVDSELEMGEIELLPGERVVYQRNEKSFSKESYQFKKDFGWKEGILYFNHSSIVEVAKTLENWYGVSIVINNIPGNSRHFTGSFNNENLENVMESLSFTFGFNYEKEGKMVKIQFK